MTVMHSRTSRVTAVLVSALMLVLISRTSPAADAPPIAGKFSPQKISEGVVPTTAPAAWSPDGKEIAFLTPGSLKVYNTETGKTRKTSIKEPFFVNWTEGDTIYVIHKEDGNKVLLAVKPASLKKKKVELETEPEAVFPITGTGGGGGSKHRLLVVTAGAKVLKIGTMLSYRLSAFDISTGRMKEIYKLGRIVPVLSAEIEYTSGWISPGPSPVDTLTIGVEHVNPPVVKPYLRVMAIDYLSGKAREIDRVPTRKFSAPASWSPDGKRLAMPGQSGRLIILEMNGRYRVVNVEITGVSPAWNPRGSQIYFGGHIVDSGGEVRESIIPEGGAESSAFWSPDGRRLALLAADGELWLLKGFNPEFVHPDAAPAPGLKEKITALKELLEEGLIEADEYRQRRGRLLGMPEGNK